MLDLFTLWCYHPTNTGEYVIAPMNVMRIGAAISAVFVVGFVGGWAYRDYRRRQRRSFGAPGASVTHDRHRTAPPRGALGHSR